jgi:hypothetical protein
MVTAQFCTRAHGLPPWALCVKAHDVRRLMGCVLSVRIASRPAVTIAKLECCSSAKLNESCCLDPDGASLGCSLRLIAVDDGRLGQ